MYRPVIISVLSIVFYPTHSLALSEYEMVKKCISASKSENIDFYSGICLGNASSIVFFSKKLGLCMPSGVSNGQMLSVFSKFVATVPELWGLEVKDLMLLAAKDAWPCQK